MVVQIDGKRCATLDDYLSFIYQRLNFPFLDRRPNILGYDDWMTDSAYFHNDIIHFIIINYNMFLSEDAEEKAKIMDKFVRFMLWWEHDVVECVVGGKPKEFNVYIVD